MGQIRGGDSVAELVWAEVGFDQEGERGFEAQACCHKGLDPLLMEFFRVLLRLCEKAVQSFEFPTALELFAGQPFAELFDECFWRFVAHGLKLSLHLSFVYVLHRLSCIRAVVHGFGWV